MRGLIALVVAGSLIAVALAAGAWEIHRLDRDVATLRAGQQPDPRLDAALTKLDALAGDVRKVKESGLRQEFYAPFFAGETQYTVAVETGYSDCSAVRELWRDHVNDVVSSLDGRKGREVRNALLHDDPDYHASLLNGFRC